MSDLMFALFVVSGIIFLFMTFIIFCCLEGLYKEIKGKKISQDTITYFKWYFVSSLVFLVFYYGTVQSETQKFYEIENKCSIITECKVISVDEKNSEIILMKNNDTRTFRINSIGSFVGLNDSNKKLSTLKKNDLVDIKFYDVKDKSYIVGFINITYRDVGDSFSKEKF